MKDRSEREPGHTKNDNNGSNDQDIFDDRKSNCNDDDALFLCRQARKLWLQNATMREDLDRVENLYRQALNSKREIITETTMTSKRSSQEKMIKNNQKRKRNKQQTEMPITTTKRKTIAAALSKEEYRKAAERLSLLYLQSGRSYKATPGLKYLKFECRLSERILNYPTNTNINNTTNGNKNKNKSNHNNRNLSSASASASSSVPKPPCCVVDDFLSPNELHHLRRVFGDTSSSYWKDHNYVIDKEPPAPYFSYVIDLKQHQKKEKNPPTFLRTIIDKILRCDSVSAKFPNLPHDARYVELWAHNRPHASGHQLHFDSDDEGRGGVPRHPIVSTVLYLSSHSKVGGPTLVTNQRLRNPTTTNLNSVHGWLVACKPARLVCFEGSVLHGVIPGKGVIPPSLSNIHNHQQQRPRRVTLMMAFWKDIKIRQGTNPGSARPWPTTPPAKTSRKKSRNNNDSRSWKLELNRTDISDFNTNEKVEERLPQQKWDRDRQQIIPIRYVYESLDGIPVPKYVEDGDGLYMPEYDRVFQGF